MAKKKKVPKPKRRPPRLFHDDKGYYYASNKMRKKRFPPEMSQQQIQKTIINLVTKNEVKRRSPPLLPREKKQGQSDLMKLLLMKLISDKNVRDATPIHPQPVIVTVKTPEKIPEPVKAPVPVVAVDEQPIPDKPDDVVPVPEADEIITPPAEDEEDKRAEPEPKKGVVSSLMNLTAPKEDEIKAEDTTPKEREELLEALTAQDLQQIYNTQTGMRITGKKWQVIQKMLNEPSEQTLENLGKAKALIKRYNATSQKEKTNILRNVFNTAEAKPRGRPQGRGIKHKLARLGADEGLTDRQINEMMKDHKNFLGCVMADEIPTLADQAKDWGKFGIIVNTDPAVDPDDGTENEGCHWIAIWVDLNDEKEIDYFDPLGDEPSLMMMKGLKQLLDEWGFIPFLPRLKVNKVKHQGESSNCGFHSMKFILDRMKGKPFIDSSGWSEIRKSEEKIKPLKKKFGYLL